MLYGSDNKSGDELSFTSLCAAIHIPPNTTHILSPVKHTKLPQEAESRHLCGKGSALHSLLQQPCLVLWLQYPSDSYAC